MWLTSANVLTASRNPVPIFSTTAGLACLERSLQFGTNMIRSPIVWAEHPLLVGQGPLEQRDRLAQPPRRLVGGGEVVPAGQGVRMVGAEAPLAVGQGPLEQRQRLLQPPRVLVGGGEVVPAGQG